MYKLNENDFKNLPSIKFCSTIIVFRVFLVYAIYIQLNRLPGRFYRYKCEKMYTNLF